MLGVRITGDHVGDYLPQSWLSGENELSNGHNFKQKF